MQQAVAVRLAAIMRELGKNRRDMAEFLGVGESRLGNWLGTGEKANMPSEAAMARLCEQVPALTMDYIYLGRLDAVPYSAAIRLKARELGLDPDAPDLDLGPVAAAVGLSNRRA
jgi:transcriptional regulator with XRE-family HTH domain